MKMVKLRFRCRSNDGNAVQFSVWVPDDGREPHELVDLLRTLLMPNGLSVGAYVNVKCVDSQAFLITHRETKVGGAN